MDYIITQWENPSTDYSAKSEYAEPGILGYWPLYFGSQYTGGFQKWQSFRPSLVVYMQNPWMSADWMMLCADRKLVILILPYKIAKSWRQVNYFHHRLLTQSFLSEAAFYYDMLIWTYQQQLLSWFIIIIWKYLCADTFSIVWEGTTNTSIYFHLPTFWAFRGRHALHTKRPFWNFHPCPKFWNHSHSVCK